VLVAARSLSAVIFNVISMQILNPHYTSSNELVHPKGTKLYSYRCMYKSQLKDTRQRNNLYLPQANLTIYQKEAYYSGINFFLIIYP